MDRKTQLISAANAYFNGLAEKDLTNVPWREDVTLRTPLAPGGSSAPLEGSAAVKEFFANILPALGDVRIVEYYTNDALTSVVAKAEVDIAASGTTLRVADLFEVDPEGRIVAQENHYDPRPAGA